MKNVPSLVLMLLGGCDKGDADDAPPTAATDSDTDTDGDADADSDADADTDTVPVEICDGIDNNGDGVVDEGFEDVDGDTIADCVDVDCEPVTVPEPVTPSLCETALAVKYTIAALLPSFGATRIGRLVDHTGDGVVDALDSPSILAPTQLALNVYDGATGALDWTVSGRFETDAGVIADVDQDGDAELVVLVRPDINESAWELRAYDGTGTQLWASETLDTGNIIYGDMCRLSVADLDGDGANEVICDQWVVDGTTGAHRFDLAGVPVPPFGTLVVADLDVDGTAEVLLGGGVYDHTGVLEWGIGLGQFVRNHPAVAQLDADPEAEVIWAVNDVGPGRVVAFEHDGVQIAAAWTTGGSAGAGMPCVADLDGDGLSEVIVPFDLAIERFETDGTLTWSHPVSGGNDLGCSLFDVDADGTPEVLFADLLSFMVLDAATGAVIYEDPTFGGMFDTTPMAVDVDNDGRTEVLVPGASGDVRAYEHVLDGWAGSGTSWGLLDYADGRIADDGSIGLPSYWVDGGYHARAATTGLPDVGDPGGFDLRVAPIGSCAASCADGPKKFVIQVGNRGSDPSPAGVVLELVAHSPQQEVQLGSEVLPEIAAGGAHEVTFVVEDPVIPGTLIARVDSSLETCSIHDDEVVVPDTLCP